MRSRPRFLRPLLAGLSLLAATVTVPAAARAATLPRAELRDLNPFTGLGDNLARSFTGWNLGLHLAGIGATPLLVASGADTRFHNFFVRHPGFDAFGTPGFIAGYALPFALGGGLLWYGLAAESPRELAAACAVLQVSLVSFAYQSLLKALTGRPAPEPVYYDNDSASATFRLGFLRGGIHYGWPSGHMMTSTAIVFSLWPLYPDSWAFKLGSGVFLAYMFVSVAGHGPGGAHWLSDMVAGTLLGLAIGHGVGQGFARRLAGQDPGGDGLSLSPTIGEVNGVTLSVAF